MFAIVNMLFVFSCESDLDKMSKSNITINGTIPDAYYTDFNITYSDSGLLKVKITGKILEQYMKSEEKPGRDVMKDSVHVRFYNQFREVTSELMADHAIRRHEDELMNAKGNVIVINSVGEKLNTERLTWDSKTKKIICDTAVTITKPGGQVIHGSGLESDERFENYKINNVTGEIKVKREKAPE